jgi:hypothetical protein
VPVAPTGRRWQCNALQCVRLSRCTGPGDGGLSTTRAETGEPNPLATIPVVH